MSLRFFQKLSFLIGAPFALAVAMASNAFAQAAPVPAAQWNYVGVASWSDGTPVSSEYLSGPGSVSSSVSDQNGTGSATLTQVGLPSPFLSASSVAVAAQQTNSWSEVMNSATGALTLCRDRLPLMLLLRQHGADQRDRLWLRRQRWD